jgi:hypothetical protein
MKALPLLLMILFAGAVRAGDLFVTTTNESGAGSLAQAILDANNSGGADTIKFNIGAGGFQTITLTTALPAVTETVTIDGTTQPNYGGNPLIDINGNFRDADGITLNATGGTGRGSSCGTSGRPRGRRSRATGSFAPVAAAIRSSCAGSASIQTG